MPETGQKKELRNKKNISLTFFLSVVSVVSSMLDQLRTFIHLWKREQFGGEISTSLYATFSYHTSEQETCVLWRIKINQRHCPVLRNCVFMRNSCFKVFWVRKTLCVYVQGRWRKITRSWNCSCGRLHCIKGSSN